MCNQREKFLKRFSHDCVSRWIIYTGERVMMNLIMSSGTRGGVCASSSSSRWRREEARTKSHFRFSSCLRFIILLLFLWENFILRREKRHFCVASIGAQSFCWRGFVRRWCSCSRVISLRVTANWRHWRRDPLDYSRLFIFLHCRAENKIGSLASGARGF